MSENASAADEIAHLRARLAAAEAEIARLRLFEQVIAENDDGIFLSDAQGRLIYANQAGAQMAGYPDRTALMESAGTGGFSSPDEQRHFQEQVLPRLLAEGRYHWMATTTRPDGSQVIGANTSFLIRDPAGAVQVLAASVRDVTEHMAVQRRLALSETYLDTLVKSLPIAFYVLDAKGQFLLSRGRLLGKLGLVDDQVVGLSAFELYGGPDHGAVADGIRQTLAGTATELESRDDTLDGDFYHWFTPLYSEDGAVVGLMGVSLDISEQRSSNREMARFQENTIEAQRTALRELSTPLVPIADGVLAMPLVGTIDDGRAMQIMETLLEGIAAQQADVAILDITGVRVVDTQVADALLRVARAAKLLGTQIMLTGIGAEIAQTLVSLGADMSDIRTAATLRDGVTLALAERNV